MLYVYHHHRWFVIPIISLKGPKDLSKVYTSWTSSVLQKPIRQSKSISNSWVVVTDKEKFLLFDQEKDSFFGSLMQANADFFNMWKVCRIIFVLSHGQADVERSFNISWELLVENMKELSLISQRIVCDHCFACKNDLLNY